MIVLLLDGDNAYGSVATAMTHPNDAGIVFRHETVVLGTAPRSDATRDLRQVPRTAEDNTTVLPWPRHLWTDS